MGRRCPSTTGAGAGFTASGPTGADTVGVVAVDLNADLAEGEDLSAGDLAVLDSVTSASLACGFHAGNRTLMRATAEAARGRGVVLGAHVSYRDRPGFGRRALEVEPDRLTGDIVEQCGVLAGEVAVAGGSVEYVKPHGALYNRMAVDPGVTAAVVEGVRRAGIGVLVAQPGTVAEDVAVRAGLRVVPEGFPDRGYRSDGRLADRGLPGAVIGEPGEVGRRAVSLARDGGLVALDGQWVAIGVETLCIHGDAPGAGVTARRVRVALEERGVVVRPFIADGHTGRSRPR